MDCRDFYEKIGKTNYSTIYKNSVLQNFKTIFKHAEKYFNLRSDPSRFINKFKQSFEENVKKNEKEKNVWNDEEFELFINEVKKQNYRMLFILLFYTGMRLGEALALTWKDFYDESLSINKSVTRKTNKGSYEIRQPKNASSYRIIKLGNNIALHVNAFKEKEKLIPGFNNEWFIFGRSKPLVLASIDRIKESAIKDSGVKRIRIHDFRHSHASNLIASNVNIVAVSKRLGHSTVNMTLNIYTHLFAETEDKLIKEIECRTMNIIY